MESLPEERYLDRELSWIDFNARVLHEALDESNPLMERLKFLGIVSSNFDEFFMVRAPGLREDDPVYSLLYPKAFGLIRQMDLCLEERIFPELFRQSIVRVPAEGLSTEQHAFVKNLFLNEILPVLTPIAIRSEDPEPGFVNLGLYIVVRLLDPAEPSVRRHAVVEIPKNCSRAIALPSGPGYAFMLAEDIIPLFFKELFAGHEILAHGILRITRASELSLDEEKDEDFAKVMGEALRARRHNRIARVEMAGPENLLSYFRKLLKVPEEKVYIRKGAFDLKAVSDLSLLSQFEPLKRPAWDPRPVPDFENTDNLWKLIGAKDVIVHHPYETFECFVRFLNDAARDPDVLAIKQTLYRAGESSGVIQALEKAAENGKQVTVLVELKARFDEQKNIGWAQRLIRAGATVLYGVAGIKTHAKACLVIRREAEGIKRYVHLSTGNYNEKTSHIYSDTGLFTSRQEITRDISSLFNVVTGFSHPVGFSKIEMAPYGLRRRVQRLILRESMRTRKEQPGLILAKMNSLADPQVIEALYRASQAGVVIKLNVRGICCLKPGLKGMSENIEVISVVDMFLEHSRCFYFFNGGDEEVYLSSADWMTRNFDRRIEIMFGVEDPKLRKHLKDLLEFYFRDNVKSWRLGPDGVWKKKEASGSQKFRVQEYLCRRAQERENYFQRAMLGDLKPQHPKTKI